MSTTIDEKVVSMQFDNSNFEKNVSTSMGTLEKLKQSLNFGGASKGLEELKDISNQTDMSVLSNGIETVKTKFSAMQIIGVTALMNITNSAINAGKRMISALTIDPVRTGLSEYELKMNSVQTIMASTGESLGTVNKYLEELNKYADQTIYSFSDMTSNIGKFTNAGVKLEDAVSAIKGISNVAAVSGANTNEASRAMYNFSQALSAGYVKLIDWKSIENANMATVEFKNQLIDTAVALGTVKKNADGTYTTLKGNVFSATKNFNEVLQDQWMTSEVLVQTLGEYSDATTEIGKKATAAATEVKTFTQLFDTLKESAQSGWAQTWELIIGDLNEAKELWTNVSNAIGGLIDKMSTARNTLIKGALNSGFDQLMDAGIMDQDGYSHFITELAKEHGVAFDQMIKDEGSFEAALKKGLGTGVITSDMMTKALGRLTDEYGEVSEENLKNLGYTEEQVKALKKLNEQVQNGSISMDDFANKIQRASGRELLFNKETGIFVNLWNAALSIIKPIKEAFREIFPATTSDKLYNIIKAIQEFTSKLKLGDEQSDKLKRTFKGLFAMIDIAWSLFKSVAGAAGTLFGVFLELADGILSVTAMVGDFILGLRDTIKETGIFSKQVGSISQIIGKIATVLKDVTTTIFGGIINLIKGFWPAIKDMIGNLTSQLSGAFDGEGGLLGGVMDLLNSGLLIGLLIKLKSVMSSIDKFSDAFKGFLDDIKDSVSNFTNIFSSLGDTLKAFQNKLKAEALKAIAVSIAILAAALLVLSLIDKERMVSALAGMALSLGILMGVLTILDKNKGGYIKNIIAMQGLAMALFTLSLGLKILGTMSWDKIAIALVAMNGALLSLTATVALLSQVSKLGDAKGVGKIYVLSLTLITLGAGLKILATMSWDDIGRALVVLNGALLTFAGTLALLALISKIGNAKGAGQILVLSMALISLGAGLKILGTMSWDDIGRALVAMNGALLSLTATLALLALVTKIGGRGAATTQLVVMVGSLLTLGLSLKLLATMGWDDIGRALGAMGGALAILSVAMLALAGISKISGPTSLMMSAAAILVMVAAINLLVPALLILGKMSPVSIVTSLLTIAGAIVIFAAAAKLVKSAIPSMLALSVSFMTLGIGLLFMATSLTLIATAVAIFVNSSISAAHAAEVVAESFVIMAVGVAKAIIEFCKVIRDGAPAIGEMIASLLLAAIDACVKVIPELAAGIAEILVGVLNVLADYVPDIVASIFELLLGLINSIGQYIPQLVQATFDLFMKFFEGVIAALENIDKETLIKGLIGIGLISALLLALSAMTALVPGAMIGIIGVGAVIAELAIMLAAIGALARIPGLTDIIADGGKLLQAVGTAIGQFIGGIAGGIAEGFANSLPSLGTSLSNFMTNLQPFINGLSAIDDNVLQSAKSLASLILVITAAQIIDSLTKWITGGVSLEKFGHELGGFGKGIKQFADEVSGVDGKNIKAAAEAGKALGEMAKAIPTSGGLWDLIAGKNDLAGFASQLGEFGVGVKEFANEVKGVDGNVIKSAADGGKALAQMASKLPTSGGLWNAVKGEVSMSDFASQLKIFGSAIVNFTNTTKILSLEDVNKVTESSKTLAQMISTLPTSGGLWNAITGKNSMSNFASQLSIFADGLKDFVIKIKDAGDVSEVINQITALNDALISFSTSGIKEVNKSFKNSKGDIKKSVSDMLKVAIDTVKNKIDDFVKAGKNYMKEFIKAIESYKSKVKKAFLEVIDNAVKAAKAKDVYDDFYSVGKYLVKGFNKAISDYAPSTSTKVTEMVNNALKAAKKALGIQSPSKEFYAIGEYTISGFNNAMDDGMTNVYDSGYDVASYAVKGFSKAINSVSSLIENGIDNQPTIKPVLDLSEITDGADTINGMFGMTPSVGVMSNINSISSSMNKNQNGSNMEVISAIKDLNKSLSNSSGNVYNINGVTYDDGSNISKAIEIIARAALMEGRV